MNSKTITREQLSAMFDHTNLHADASREDFDLLCKEAAEGHFAMVAINPEPVSYCKERLAGTGVHVGAAISFPLGQNTIEQKAAETRLAIADGADEIDYVLHIGRLKAQDAAYIKKEMETITSICHEAGVLCKVILETCYLEKQEIILACEIAREVRPDFVKTSTGFGTAGATAENVKLMKDTVGDAVKVKAAGGIRSWEACAAMIDAGAERIGTSSSLKILKEYGQSPTT